MADETVLRIKERIREEMRDLLGVTMADGGLARLDDPLLIAEDFASYQLFVPGVFLLLGTGTGIALHSDEFVLDERVLLRGVEAYRRLLLA